MVVCYGCVLWGLMKEQRWPGNNHSCLVLLCEVCVCVVCVCVPVCVCVSVSVCVCVCVCLTPWFCADCRLDVISSQYRLLDLTALHQVERHHERLQGLFAFRQEDHLKQNKNMNWDKLSVCVCMCV